MPGNFVHCAYDDGDYCVGDFYSTDTDCADRDIHEVVAGLCVGTTARLCILAGSVCMIADQALEDLGQHTTQQQDRYATRTP